MSRSNARVQLRADRIIARAARFRNPPVGCNDSLDRSRRWVGLLWLVLVDDVEIEIEPEPEIGNASYQLRRDREARVGSLEVAVALEHGAEAPRHLPDAIRCPLQHREQFGQVR